MKKKIVLVIITWFELAPPYTLEIEADSKWDCEDRKQRIETSWIEQGLPEGFGYIMECRERDEQVENATKLPADVDK